MVSALLYSAKFLRAINFLFFIYSQYLSERASNAVLQWWAMIIREIYFPSNFYLQHSKIFHCTVCECNNCGEAPTGEMCLSVLACLFAYRWSPLIITFRSNAVLNYELGQAPPPHCSTFF